MSRPSNDFLYRLWQKYMARKGYKWNGSTAPELTPNVRSDQVLALAEIVDELEERVKELEKRLEKTNVHLGLE